MDLLGCSGLLDDAKRVMKTMPMAVMAVFVKPFLVHAGSVVMLNWESR